MGRSYDISSTTLHGRYSYKISSDERRFFLDNIFNPVKVVKDVKPSMGKSLYKKCRMVL